MSEVYSIRIPRKLRETLNQLREVDWQEEIRRFLSGRAREEHLRRLLKEAKEHRSKMGREISAAQLIREDRQRGR